MILPGKLRYQSIPAVINIQNLEVLCHCVSVFNSWTQKFHLK